MPSIIRLTPAFDIEALSLYGTHQTLGSLTANLWAGYNPSGTMVAALRNSGRLQLGFGDTTLDGIVRLAINTTPTQSVNLIQASDGTDTLFAFGPRGGLVLGAVTAGLAATKRLVLNISSGQSANVAEIVSSGSLAIIRVQANGNLLVGGPSTGASNNAFEKLTVQGSSAETANLSRWTSGIANTTDLAINQRAVIASGRISSAVLFTDDNATPASAKLFGFDVSEIATATTRTLGIGNWSGKIAAPIGDGTAGDVITSGGTGVQPSWAALTAVAHNILSTTHSDTLAATLVRGDTLAVNATPKLARVPIGPATYVWTSDGTDPSWQPASGGGGGAPVGEKYVIIGPATAGLTDERILTGTADQIILADLGAGLGAVLSTPQDLDTAALFQVGTLGVGGAAAGGNFLDVFGISRISDTLVVDQQADRDGLAIHYNTLTGLTTARPFRIIDDGGSWPESYFDPLGGYLAVPGLAIQYGAFLGSFVTTLTGNRLYSLPDVSGEVILGAGTQTIGGTKTLSGIVTFSSATKPLFKSGITIEDPGAGTNTIAFISPTAPTTHTRTLPGANAAGYLTNNGTGTESWSSANAIVALSTDSRLSDARTPTAHATSHKSGGSDVVLLDELGAPTDILTLNASLTAHGLLPKLPGGTTTFLRADGTYAAPTAAAADPVYSPGAFTIVTETGRLFIDTLILSGTEEAVVEGTGTLVLI